MSAVPVDLAVLQACEVAAGNRLSGRLAFMLWLIGTQHGWQQARMQLPRATFFRQLAILRKAGLEVPKLRTLEAAPAPAVDASPFSRLLRLPGQRFTVRKPIDADWPPGATGIVESVGFRELQWFVAITGLPGSTLDGSVTHVPLREFLACTELPQARN